MTTFGLDLSHYQPDTFSLSAAAGEGVQFAILKAGDGVSVDAEFAPRLSQARSAGLLVAAYWYQRSGFTAADHVSKILAIVPADVPVIMDVEQGSGSILLTRDIISRLRAAGRLVPLLYLPRWYWQQLGSPDLTGLPPLWSSRYPDYTTRDLAGAYAQVPASYWQGYGGLPVYMIQMTSSARVAGYAPLDANVVIGSRADLALFLGQAPATSTTTDSASEEDYVMERAPHGGTTGGIKTAVNYQLATSMLREHDVIIAPGDSDVVLYASYHWAWNTGTGGNPVADPAKPIVIPVQGSYSYIVPKGTGKVDLVYWSDDDFSVTVAPR